MQRWTTFAIPQMDCPQELGIISAGLQTLDGIVTLQPDYLQRQLRVQYDEQQVQPEQIRDQLVQIGFPPRAAELPVVERPTRGVWQELQATPSLWLAAILVVLAIFLPRIGDRAGSAFLQPLLCVAATVIGGAPLLRSAVRAIRWRRLDMYVLVSLAAVGALLTGEWLEAATLVVLFRASLSIETVSQLRARNALQSLVELAPAVVHRLSRGDADVGAAVDIPLHDAHAGDVLLVRPGERIAGDGVVVNGASAVDEAPLTGESVPVEKSVGDSVWGGSLCVSGSLRIQLTRCPSESAAARITRLIEQARSQPADVEQFVDQFARIYTPLVVALAAVVAFALPLWHALGGPATGSDELLGEVARTWFFRGLVVLVIACPCALVLSTPVTIMSGLFRASRMGVLVKGGRFLEQFGVLRTMAFDKTGTLTLGEPSVVGVVPLVDELADDLLVLAAALEQHSEHPLGRAIHEAVPTDITVPECVDFVSLPGLGVEGVVERRKLRIASLAGLQNQSTRDTSTSPEGDLPSAVTQHLEFAGSTITLLAEHDDESTADGRWHWLAAILLRDEVRPGAAQVLAELRRLGVKRTVMLTGDRQAVAAPLAQRLGITECYAELLPDDKIAHVRRLAAEEHDCAMLGDGVNDAPALTAAPIGIAMGSGAADVALEHADIALLQPRLERLVDMIHLSRRVRRVIRQNVAMAVGLKLLVLILAAAGYASMWMAVVSDVGASLLVIANGTFAARSDVADFVTQTPITYQATKRKPVVREPRSGVK